MLKIARGHVDAMIRSCSRRSPDEACGVIIGAAGSDQPTRLVQMINADRSPTFFRFDPGEQFRLYQEMDANDEEIIVVYHSHPPPRPTPPALTSRWPRSRRLTMCWCPQPSPATKTDQSRFAHTGYWTGCDRGRDRDHGIAPRARHVDRDVNSRNEKKDPMSIEVRIPTILRTFTGGAKAVHGDGATLLQVIDDVEARHPGLKERLVEEQGCDGSSMFTSTTRTYASPEGSRRPRLTAMSSSSCPRLPAAERTSHDAVSLIGRFGRPHASRRTASVVAQSVGQAVGQARGSESDRLHQGPGGVEHDPYRRARRHASTGCHDPGTDEWQHRHLAGDGRQAGGLPAYLRSPGEHVAGAQAVAHHVGSRDRFLPAAVAPTRRCVSPNSSQPSTRTG